MENYQSERRGGWRQVYGRIAWLGAKFCGTSTRRMLVDGYCRLFGRKNLEVADPHERLMDYQ